MARGVHDAVWPLDVVEEQVAPLPFQTGTFAARCRRRSRGQIADRLLLPMMRPSSGAIDSILIGLSPASRILSRPGPTRRPVAGGYARKASWISHDSPRGEAIAANSEGI